jgi:hypothetical protein
MKKSMDVLIWAVLLFLITPSGMALASWNAVPGDFTYAWKLSLEKVLLMVMSPSDKLRSSTQIKIAERRFGEVEQVMSSEYAVEGLDNLNKQLAVTSSDIQKINKAASRSEEATQYIASLKKMSASLDEQKSKAQTGQIAMVAQKSSSTGTSRVANSNTGSNTGSVRPSGNNGNKTPNTYNIYNIYNNKPSGNAVVTRPPEQINNTNPANSNNNNVGNNQVPEVNNDDSVSTAENTVEVVNAIEETQNNIDEVIENLEAQQAKEAVEAEQVQNAQPAQDSQDAQQNQQTQQIQQVKKAQEEEEKKKENNIEEVKKVEEAVKKAKSEEESNNQNNENSNNNVKFTLL